MMTARDGPAGSRPARSGRPACTPDLIATLAGLSAGGSGGCLSPHSAQLTDMWFYLRKRALVTIRPDGVAARG